VTKATPWQPPRHPLADIGLDRPGAFSDAREAIWKRHSQAFFAGGPTTPAEAIAYLRDEETLADPSGKTRGMVWGCLDLLERVLRAAEVWAEARETLDRAQDADAEAARVSVALSAAVLNLILAEETLLDAVRWRAEEADDERLP
jgi:hypothetical protein